MSYKLLRAMKVQCADGTIELRKPGDACPEADTWANPGLWVKKGYIITTDNSPTRGLDRGKLIPMHSTTKEDAVRGMNPSDTEPPKVTEPTGLLDDDGQDADSGDEDQKQDGGQDADMNAEETKAELLTLSCADLEALALDQGIEDPGSFANKPLLAEAILATE